MTIIDSDAHVIETPETWSYMTGKDEQFRPMIFERSDKDNAPRHSNQRSEYWVINERMLSKGANVGQDTPADSREMRNVQHRLDHMTEIGVDIAVIFPTLFLRPLTKDHDIELALCRSYNRWMADIWEADRRRLRWVAVPPLLSLVDPGIVREELTFAKEHGACGIFMTGMECERIITDRYFHPLYEMAQEMDLPICFHVGINSFAVHDAYFGNVALFRAKFPILGAFGMLLQEETPSMFPELRWGFIEASASWVPYMLGDARIRTVRRGKKPSDTMLADNNFFVTVQMTDDIPDLVDEFGDDHFLIGTDYGHRDTATEIHAMQRLAEDGGIPEASVQKILTENPSRLFSIPVD